VTTLRFKALDLHPFWRLHDVPEDALQGAKIVRSLDEAMIANNR
jgi:hypothetical protein